MSKIFLIAIAVLLVIIGGGYLYTSSRPQVTDKQDLMVKTDTKLVTETPKTADSLSSKQYLPYTKEVLESSKDTRRVLYFYASWCPTCIPANADFEKNVSTLPSDVTVIRVNYNDPDTDDDEKTLATKYGITYQHTYVQIDSGGEEVTKWNGGATQELLEKIK